MDLTISLTDAQIRVLRKLDPALTARQVVQAHLDTWLFPMLAELDDLDRADVMAAYRNAKPEIRAGVKRVLGLG